jgi:hypothetical protein
MHKNVGTNREAIVLATCSLEHRQVYKAGGKRSQFVVIVVVGKRKRAEPTTNHGYLENG